MSSAKSVTATVPGFVIDIVTAKGWPRSTVGASGAAAMTIAASPMVVVYGSRRFAPLNSWPDNANRNAACA